MPSQIRSSAWIVVVAIAVTLGISLRAVDNWVSDEALGDVAVSFSGAVHVFDNETGQVVDTIDTTTVPELAGTNGGLAFDALLNLLVVSTNGGQLVKLPPAHPHTGASFPDTQDSPRSIAIDADGTIYVASAGNPSATIRRIPSTGSPTEFTVSVTDSAACIGIDIAPDLDALPLIKTTIYMVSGGSKIKRIDGVDASTASANAATVAEFTTGSNTACGIRLLPTVDARDQPALVTLPNPPTTDLVGGFLVANGANIKLVRRSPATGYNPAIVTLFDAGSGSKNWIDVAIDPDAGATPNVLDFWGVNAGNTPILAKFREGASGSQQTIPLSSFGTPGGCAINGELRFAQTIQPVQLTNGVEKTATFLQGTLYQHIWKGRNFDTLTGPVQIAVQALEVKHINNETPTCGPLNVDCRLTNFAAATPKMYSRERGVVYREIRRDLADINKLLRIGIFFPDTKNILGGEVCTVGGTPQEGTTILRDPWPHDLFADDSMMVFYAWDSDPGGVTPPRSNDSIVVDRDDVQFFLRIIKPMQNAGAQLGRSLQIAVEVRDPDQNCNFVSGLNQGDQKLVLSVTDISPNPPQNAAKGTIIGDSKGIFGILDGNGLTWATTASQYRTNLDLVSVSPDPVKFPNSKFTAGHKYRACVSSPAFYDQTLHLPIVSEACVDFNVN